jgi:gas vesicle protein
VEIKIKKEEIKMEIAESMRGTAENIIASYNARVRALGDLVADTQSTLKGFASDRKKMAKEQAENLAGFKNGVSESVGEMLKEFQESHSQMGKEQTKNLMHFITDLTNDVSSMVSGFQKDRGKMSKELKSRLAKEVKEIETYIGKKLKEFDEVHTEMSEQQKKDLAKFIGGMKSEVKRLLTDFQDEMADYRKDINSASHIWGGMASTLARAKKRGGPVGMKVEAAEGTMTVEEAVEKKGKSKETRGKVKGKKKD